MNEYKAKTVNAKLKTAKRLKELKKASGQLSTKQHKELLDSIATLQGHISALEASLSANGSAYTESQKDLVQNFTTLQEMLKSGLNVNNLKDVKQAKEIIVTNLKDLPKPVVNTTKTEIPKWLASEKGLDNLNKSVMKVVQALIDLEANNKPKQQADEYIPFRRVIRQGNRLVFDDSDWSSRSGGAGASSGGGGSTGGLTDAELRATPVPVSMSSDIEIGAVELKNGTDDTRATITASNALKVDGSAVTQPVSGTVTATPTGTQNVDVTANTIGLATSAKQDTLLTELQLKADLTETQPVSLASVPSHAVTNAGTFAVQVTSAPTTAVTGTFWQATQPVSIASTVTTTETAPTTIYNGKKSVTTAGTRVTLASSQAVKSVTIKALSTNTGIIYVGDTSVASTNGFQLSAGETISMDIANLNTVNLDSSVSGESVTYIGVN